MISTIMLTNVISLVLYLIVRIEESLKSEKQKY